MSIFTFLALCFIFNIYAQRKTCNYGGCIVAPKSGETIVCTNKYQSCIVTCNQRYQCNNINIYSGSIATIINCNNDNSCTNTNINIGSDININGLKSPYNIYDFTGEKNMVLINCNSWESCKNMSIDINGVFSQDVQINMPGNNAFLNGNLKCNLQNQYRNCDLNCGHQYQTSCNQASFSCFENVCECAGLSCPNIITRSPTINPTKIPTTDPTMEPTTTLSPTVMPTTEPTFKIIEFNEESVSTFWDKAIFDPWVYGLILTVVILICVCAIFIFIKLKKANKKLQINPYSKKITLVQKDKNYNKNNTNKNDKNMNIYLLSKNKKYNTFSNNNNNNKNNDNESYMEINERGSTLEMEDVSEIYANHN